jgi:hypothetical protein
VEDVSILQAAAGHWWWAAVTFWADYSVLLEVATFLFDFIIYLVVFGTILLANRRASFSRVICTDLV